MNLIINTDGGARGNPGPASYAFVIKTGDGVILHQEGKKIGVATNNIAEYMGVLRALEYVNKHFQGKAPHKIEVVGDSQLISMQLEGKYQVKNPQLKELYSKIKLLERDLGRVSYKNVPRSENFIADKLVNKALDE